MNFGKSLFLLLVGCFACTGFAAMEFKEAEITTLKNMVEHDPGSGAAPAKVNEKIKEKSKVSTAAASMAELTFADSSITRMGANTQFSFQSKERLVKLESGTVLVNTPPGNGGATVDCGGVTGAVSGTTFMASRDGSGNVMFVLLEGQGGLKVTVGGASTVLKPGQAASVGAQTIQESKSTSPGDAGGTKPVATGTSDDSQPGGAGQGPASATGGEGGDKPAAATPKIQVFEVDVKKVMATSPLVTDFKNELPSVGKIEKTIESQQKAVQEGKLEKLEVEVVAVKSKDGDPLVGAPRVEKEEMVVVNRKQDLVGRGQGGGGDNLDIDTAAGPGAGGGGSPVASAPPPPSRTSASAPPPTTTTPLNPGQIAGNLPTATPSAPTSLAFSIGSGTGSLTLNRALLSADTVSFSGGFFPGLNMASGATTASFSFDPKNYFLGFNVDALNPNEITSLVASRSVTASVAGLSDAALFAHNLTAIQNANPARSLLYAPTGSELLALDAFFYFTAKAPGVSGGPALFFADAAVSGTDRTLAALGSSIQLFSGQNWDFFAARKFTAAPGVLNFAPSAGKSQLTYFGNTVDLGAAHPVWQGTVDPRTASTSLGSRYLTLNSDYLPVYDKTLVGAQPTGFFDSFGSYLSPLENFPVWDDAGGSISSAQVQINLTSSSVWTLVAGNGGIAGRGLDINANGSAVQMLTSGDLSLKTSRVAGVGPGVTGETLVLEARGKVKLGTDGALDLDVPTNAGLPEQQQVRLEAQTDPINIGNPLSGNLAVVRTGDSLELRNVTVRGFAETRLEKRNPTTKALEGRVLISGSAVRDFKIKELVGAAVNSDAKIQMMALDQNGRLAGDMVVEGKMPVQAKIASALAEVGETLPSATASAMVDAKQIDVAARNLKFENANLVAMNAITARANTILIQNSFMTVVRNNGMINLYVQSGLVNTTYGTQVAGRVNFDGANKFQIGSNYFEIGNQAQLSAAYGNNLTDFSQNGGTPQAGKVNVLRL